MRNRAIFAVLFAFCSFSVSQVNGNWIDSRQWEEIVDPDLERNVTELISSKGYPVEDHVVQTEDGYLLSVQRIPHGQHTNVTGGQVVFLQHGLLSSSADWVLNLANESLGFILADKGYDVWMGNVRGNVYSRHHIKLSPSSFAFWNFSFDEMASYDLPAMINYVLNVTDKKQLYYIGHSQGTTMAFAHFSESPEMNSKVKLYIALAPVATVGHIKSAIKYLSYFASEIDLLLELLGVNELLPNNALMRFLAKFACESELHYVCENVIFLFTGSDVKQLNGTRMGVYVSHMPAGASAKSVVHYAQMVLSKQFRKFDYGRRGNKEHYNQTSPPDYDVSKITTPVAILWAQNDYLADPTDVTQLKKRLKTLVSDYCISDSAFNHVDFVIALEAKSLVYDQVLELLKKYS